MSKTDKKRVNSIITVSRFDNKLTFAFAGVGQFTFDPDRVSAENRARAMMHGFEQRIRDAAALSVDRETGRSATPQAKHDAALRIAEHLMSGSTDWAIRVAASAGPDAGLTLLGMVRALGKTLDEVEAVIAATMTKREVDRAAALKLWANSKQVAQAILDIKRERADAGADAEDLLGEIMGDDESDDETDDSDAGEDSEDEEALM